MLPLKHYQQRSLDVLRAYFRLCSRTGNASTAFYQITEETFGQGISYIRVPVLPGLPYVCLRLPTGGGKTLLGCHAIGIVSQELLQVERPVVVWLVPSDAIREQTLKAFKNPSHPYRQALEQQLGSVTILDVADALAVQPSVLSGSTTILVSTMQAFRVENTDGRKVYEPNGQLMAHFDGLDETIASKLESNGGGRPVPSLANVLRIHRPIVIVDEAHNARTKLSFDTLARFQPSCIIEFTATPAREDNPSNVLHSVSAAELKAEEMIKLPIWLETRTDWKPLLGEAVLRREGLENAARLEHQQTGEYLRPILLVQAQPTYANRPSVTVDTVRNCLIEDCRVPADQIAIATGDKNQIEGVNLLDPMCPIRYVITIQALREGWDCPFAYVLCSVAEIGSPTYIEQVLGRILRLPSAKRKQSAELNMAYAYVSSQNFATTARTLTDALVNNGFEKQEAGDFVRRSAPATQPSLFDTTPPTNLVTSEVAVTERPDLKGIPPETRGKVEYDASSGTLVFRGVMERRDKDYLVRVFQSTEAKDAIERLYRENQRTAIAAQEGQTKTTLSVPLLAYRQGDLLEPFEATHFLERPWDLKACGASLSEAEFASRVDAPQVGEITVTDAGRIQQQFISNLQGQLQLLGSQAAWTVPEIVYWLDTRILHPDITPTDAGIFLMRLVQSLLDERGFALAQLTKERYRLRQAAEAKIKQHRDAAHQSAWQSILFDGEPSRVEVTPDLCFTFKPDEYPCSFVYSGGYRFTKHYFPRVGELADKGEELECAQWLDSLPEVETWVRNLERQPNHSFWLQTSTDRFYPDFVCKLTDGRILVVEYKGEDRWSNDDSKEKRNLGEIWAKRSGGRCQFVMPKGKDFQAIKTTLTMP